MINKKIVAFGVGCAILASSSVAFAGGAKKLDAIVSSMKLFFNGRSISGNMVTVKGVTYLPTSILTKNLGLKINSNVKKNILSITGKNNSSNEECANLKRQLKDLNKKLKSFEATSSKIKVYSNDQQLSMKDDKGNDIKAFVKNGTVYLPMKTVANSLGKAYSYDGANSSIYIGQHSSDKPSVMLSQLDYFDKYHNFGHWKLPKDNLGNMHDDNITSGYDSYNWRIYNINGKYSRIKGKFVVHYNYKDTRKQCILKILAEGKVIYTSPVITHGVEPVSFDVNIKGVLKLGVSFEEVNNYYCEDIFGIVDTGLYQ